MQRRAHQCLNTVVMYISSDANVPIFIVRPNPQEHNPYEKPDRPGFGNPENWDPAVRPIRSSSKIARPGHHGRVDHRLATAIPVIGWGVGRVYIGGFANFVPWQEIFWKILSYVLVTVILVFAFLATVARLQHGAPIAASLMTIVGVGSGMILVLRFVGTAYRIKALRTVEFADPIGYRNRGVLKHAVEMVVVAGWMVWLLVARVPNLEFVSIELGLIGFWVFTRWFASRLNRPTNVWERRRNTRE